MKFTEFVRGHPQTSESISSRPPQTKTPTPEIAHTRNQSRRQALKLLGTLALLGSVSGFAYLTQQKRTGKQEGPGNHPDTAALTPEILPEDKVREIYNRGFESVMQNIPATDTAAHQHVEVQALSQLKAFRQDFVRWAALEGDQYVSLEENNSNGGWMAVVPMNHPRIPHTNLAGLDPEQPVIQLKPSPITPTWAGIILTHELGHLLDRISGVEPVGADKEEFLKGEIRGYILEGLLIHHLSGGKFVAELEQLTKEYKLTTPESVAALLSTPLFDVLAERLDKTLPDAKCRSPHERAARNGFYLVALSFQTVDNEAIPPKERMHRYLNIIAAVQGSSHKLNV